MEEAGANLVEVSPLYDTSLPAVDALYAGGGFPEEHAEALSRNAAMRRCIAAAVDGGLPVWAECGGLMYLAQSLVRDGTRHDMVGALPVTVEQTKRPQGHGYVAATVDGENPFFSLGTKLTGHEFHYSRLAAPAPSLATVLAVERGVGVGQGRDGLRHRNVVASYTHLHALGATGWAPALVQAARGAADGTPWSS